MSNRLSPTVVGILLVAGFSAIFIFGCNSFFGRTWTGTYSGTPLTFTAPRDSASAVWNRARAWFTGYNTPRLSVSNDTLLQSEETQTAGGSYGVAVQRKDTNDVAMFEVTYTMSNPKDKRIRDRAKDRALELAYVSRTADNQQAFNLRGSH